MERRRSDLNDFYTLLVRWRRCLVPRVRRQPVRAAWAGHGAGSLSFMEEGEVRSDSGTDRRIVRVGTHALKAESGTKLWQRRVPLVFSMDIDLAGSELGERFPTRTTAFAAEPPLPQEVVAESSALTCGSAVGVGTSPSPAAPLCSPSCLRRVVLQRRSADEQPDRELWPDRRLRDGGAGRARRLNRLALLAAVRLREPLRRG